MKKILFIATRNPYSGRFSGDVINSLKIINFLKKKNQVDIITLYSKKTELKKRIIYFKSPNYFLKIFYVLDFLLRLKPLQFGLFFSKKMKEYIEKNAKRYDLLYFYHIRSSQYLPKNYKRSTIIEMGDLYSSNYYQTFCNLNIFNPLKYIYLIESILIKRAENRIFQSFNKIILFSKNEVKKINKIFRKKIYNVNISIKSIQKKFTYSLKNNKILFIGNLGYLPNLLAVKDFINNSFFLIKKEIPDVKFLIIGDVSKLNKFFFSFKKDVIFLGQQNNIKKFIKSSICGLANIKIATGVQSKVLTYMSYGLPVVCSKKVASNFKENTINYNDNNDLVKKIVNLKNNKKLSKKFSNKSLKFLKEFREEKVCSKYLKIVSFNK
ncbi:glycosyltransferase [Pelagibacteraceae bacterium]|jgi:polysaccharide biosynthesis protein PslH|nr:glycosyltransferase [Pelagibacteraceae bacterium]